MGVISGIVTYPNGQPYRNAKVSASLSGILSGGVTGAVWTDAQGRFTLAWSGNNSAELVFCNGKTVATKIHSGTDNLHFVVR